MNLFKSPGGKTSLIYTIAGTTASLIILILILLKLANNNRLNNEMSAITSSISRIRSRAGNAERFDRETSEIEKKMGLAINKIPRDAQIPQAIEQLTSATEGQKLNLVSIMPKEAVEVGEDTEMPPAEPETGPAYVQAKPEYIRIPIEIQLRGSYTGIGQCLDSLRYLPRLVTVEEVDIKTPEEPGHLAITLIVSVSYLGD